MAPELDCDTGLTWKEEIISWRKPWFTLIYLQNWSYKECTNHVSETTALSESDMYMYI